MRKSLGWKLNGILLLVSLVGLIVVALLSRDYSVSVFRNYLLDNSEKAFRARALEYYQRNGSWEGVADYFPPMPEKGRYRRPPPMTSMPAAGFPPPPPSYRALPAQLQQHQFIPQPPPPAPQLQQIFIPLHLQGDNLSEEQRAELASWQEEYQQQIEAQIRSYRDALEEHERNEAARLAAYTASLEDYAAQRIRQQRTGQEVWLEGAENFLQDIKENPQQALGHQNAFDFVRYHPAPYLLVSNEGVVLVAAGSYELGQQLRNIDLMGAEPLLLEDEQIASVIFAHTYLPLRHDIANFESRLDMAYIISIAIALLVAGIIGMLFTRSLVRPLRAMTEATRKLLAGEYQQVPVKRRDELGQLATSFNQMMAGLELAERNRQQMSADIAHELRTPLTGLAWHLEAFQAGALEPSSDNIALMQGQVQHLQHLVEDLRVLSLADAGKFSINSEMHDPNALLAEIVRQYQPLAQDKKVDLQLDSPPLEPLPLDYARMMQVMHNALSNALHFTLEGGKITLKAQEHGDKLELAISDTGVGIPAEKLPHVFERFYQGDSARQQEAESSSGLGLAIVKTIVEAHGGEVAIVSEVGKGTTLSLNLPRHASPKA